MHQTRSAAFEFLLALAKERGEANAEQPITTHAAWVFLAGDTAYKIKRPVNLGFLDFSTLEARRLACTREVELNRRFAPDLYRGLFALIEGRDGRLELTPAGDLDRENVIEWVVVMTRFDTNSLLSRRLIDGSIPAQTFRALGDRVHDMHAVSPVVHEPNLVDRLQTVIADISSALDRAPFLDGGLAETFRQRATEVFTTLRPRLLERMRCGHIRRCHGDLHCENIVLIKHVATAFDALEFDEALGSVDVLYDTGFLLMDLSVRDAVDGANSVFNAYLDAAANPIHIRDLHALRFFMSLRAGVRAMVTIHKYASAGEDAVISDADAANDYARFACRMLEAQTPQLIAIGGGSGTGKSTVSGLLAPRLGQPPGAIHLRSDVIRKQLAGVDVTTRLPASAYTPEASDRVYRAMLARAELALAAGHSVVLDAVFGRADEQAAVLRLAAKYDARLITAWLTLSVAQQKARVAARVGDASDATPQLIETQRARLEVPSDWFQLDASCDPKATAQRILRAIQQTPNTTPSP